MKMSHAFEPARPMAQHCAELTARAFAKGQRPEDDAEAIAAWRRDIGQTLSQELAVLLSGERLSVSLAEPEWMPGQQVFDRIGPVAANSLLRCGEAEQTLLLSIDLATAIALTDRSFGGEGALAQDVPDTLPRSAALLVDQVARIIAGAIAGASGFDPDAADVIVRSESAPRLRPFAPDARCAMFAIEIAAGPGHAWHLWMALTAEQLAALLPGNGESSPLPARDASAALAAIPLPLRAVLAEVTLSLGQLERLRPGDRFAIPAPRDVPLRIGEITIAHGTIGTRHDRMALQLTGAISERINP